MRSSLRQQLAYSFFWLFFLAIAVGGLVAWQSPEKVAELSRIEYFEAERPQTFPVRELSAGFFFWWRLALPVVLLVFAFLSLTFFRTYFTGLPSAFFQALRKVRVCWRQELSSLSTLQKLAAGSILALLIAQRAVYFFRYPIHTDEAASYFLFIRNGLWAVLSYYPIPNNHLLQNLLALPLDFIFPDAFWVLRFWPVVFSLLFSVLAFFLIRRFSGFTIAFLATSLFSFTSLTLFFSTQGRGYMLLALLSLLAFGCVLLAFRSGRNSYWFLFSVVSSLGFFTVPTFLFPFAACLVFSAVFIAFRQQWQQVLPLVLAGFTTGLGVLLLYLPLLLVSGPEALLGNKYVQPLTPEQFAEKLPLFLSETQGELLGGKYGTGVLVFYISTAVLALLFLFRNLPFLRKLLPKQTTRLIGFVLVTSLVVYGLLRLQLVLPPPRVLFFKSFFDLLGLAVLIGMLAKILFRKALLRTLALLAGVLVFAFFQQREAGFFLTDYPEPYYTYPPLNRQIRESGAAKVYVEEPFYRLFLQYDYARFRMPLQLDAGNVYRSRQYDFIVLRKEAPFPAGIPESGYRQVYEDGLVKAFRPIIQPNLPEKQ